jgi:hypothetical protein
MAIHTWPAVHIPKLAHQRVITNGRANDSAESGVTQTVTRPGGRWGLSITMRAQPNEAREDFEGYLVGLNGREHRLRIYDWKRRRPRGTCNLTGVTLGADAAQFATTATLAGCGAGKTLLRGDWIGFSSGQLCRITADATADGAGAMTITFQHSLRTALTSGAALTLDKPTALYILTEPIIEFPRQPGPVQPEFGFDLIEVFA